MNTITLPDPQTGEPVELAIPEGCPYFIYSDKAPSGLTLGAEFKSPLRIVALEQSQCHSGWQGDDVSKPNWGIQNRDTIALREWLPIIAAVAAEWWTAVAELPYKNRGDTQRKLDALEQVRQWRRFTAKPKAEAAR